MGLRQLQKSIVLRAKI